MTQASDRLALARWEADRHAAVLDEALAEWRSRPLPQAGDLDHDAGLRQWTDLLSDMLTDPLPLRCAPRYHLAQSF
jgi:hypothetical protein